MGTEKGKINLVTVPKEMGQQEAFQLNGDTITYTAEELPSLFLYGFF